MWPFKSSVLSLKRASGVDIARIQGRAVVMVVFFWGGAGVGVGGGGVSEEIKLYPVHIYNLFIIIAHTFRSSGSHVTLDQL